MRFTVIGHACLYVETGAERVLVDPWLSGSCYWRSWWHFPPNTKLAPEVLEPDYIYLSHHHFDHFHYPSLRRISKRARVLIPRFGVDVMRHELDQLGFTDVAELAHGAPTTLPSGTRVASYQYGPDDSAFVIERGGVVLADLNDCKIKGPSARPMLRAFGPPTFAFKSHSFAQAYPNCYRIADAADAKLMTREDFLESFIDAIRELEPAYAIPFASMVAFLHPECRQRNMYAVRPPAGAAAIVHMREGVLADAIAKNVVAFVHISMRVRIDLAPGGVQTDFLFWGLLSLRELGYFPLRRMATPRAARVLWRRRAEAWGFIRSLFGTETFDEKVMGTLMNRGARN